MGIAENYVRVKDEVRQACIHAGRPADAAMLLGVSKTVGLDGVRQAVEAGATALGENRPDQILEKSAAFPEVDWHFIGNIQSRRISDIVSCACLIHSLYQEKHARKINDEAAKIGKVQRVLIEVNVSGEESKSGVAPAQAKALLDVCLGLPNVEVCGLMTMAPIGSEDVARETFAGLASLFGELSSHVKEAAPEAADSFCQLSMGMTDDWRAAIDEGSTIVRVGRAIFSDTSA